MTEYEAATAFKTLIQNDTSILAPLAPLAALAPLAPLAPKCVEALLQTLDCFCETAGIQAMRRVFFASGSGPANKTHSEVSDATKTYLARQFGRCEDTFE